MTNNISSDSARNILDHLLQIGKITQEDIQEGLVTRPTTMMMRVVDFVHTMFCRGAHVLGDNPDCYYHIEEDSNDCWTKSFHTSWLRRTISIMRFLNIGSEEEFRSIYGQTKKILDVVADLELKEPAAVQLAWLLLEFISEEDLP